MKNINKTAYPASGASSGVYLRYTVDPFSGAGIYVEGNAAVQLSTSGATAQVYTIKQVSTTTIVTIVNTLNTPHRDLRRRHAQYRRRTPTA